MFRASYTNKTAQISKNSPANLIKFVAVGSTPDHALRFVSSQTWFPGELRMAAGASTQVKGCGNARSETIILLHVFFEQLFHYFFSSGSKPFRLAVFAVFEGYTHMQRAMPTTVGTWLDSFAQGWKDATNVLEGACLGRTLRSKVGQFWALKKMWFRSTPGTQKLCAKKEEHAGKSILSSIECN